MRGWRSGKNSQVYTAEAAAVELFSLRQKISPAEDCQAGRYRRGSGAAHPRKFCFQVREWKLFLSSEPLFVEGIVGAVSLDFGKAGIDQLDDGVIVLVDGDAVVFCR